MSISNGSLQSAQQMGAINKSMKYEEEKYTPSKESYLLDEVLVEKRIVLVVFVLIEREFPFEQISVVRPT